MTNSNSNATDLATTDELLGAYLDGELDAAQRLVVETQLARDDAFRRRLGDLERAWDLLDELPKAVADESFVRSTVEMVALAAEHEAVVSERRSVWPRRMRTAAVGAMVLCAATLGYRAANAYVQRDNHALARDLPVLENLDLLRRIDDVGFLQQLHKAGLFEAMDKPDELSGENRDATP